MLNIGGKKFYIFFVILFISIQNYNVIASSSVRYARVYGRDYVYLRDVARYYGMKCSIGKKNTVLSSQYSRMVFTVDKKYCYINNIKVDLLFASIKYKKYRCISSKDFLKTIDPIMRHWALNKHELKKIMLDPGHGGRDKGATGRRMHEKDFTLSLTKKIASILRKKGYQVSMTRSSGRFVELKDRAALAKRFGADIFVSIHANQAANKSVSGIESFCMTPSGSSSTHSRRPSSKVYKGNKYDANNTALTYWIQRALLTKTKAVDRGLKHARFLVLKEAPCPSILIEAGFLSNYNEEKRLATEWYQGQLAKGIVEGILRYDYQLKRRK